jgi:hypothetical protein
MKERIQIENFAGITSFDIEIQKIRVFWIWGGICCMVYQIVGA